MSLGYDLDLITHLVSKSRIEYIRHGKSAIGLDGDEDTMLEPGDKLILTITKDEAEFPYILRRLSAGSLGELPTTIQEYFPSSQQQKAFRALTISQFLASRGYEKELVDRLIRERRIYTYKRMSPDTRRRSIESLDREVTTGDHIEILFTTRELEFQSVQASQESGILGKMPYTLESSITSLDLAGSQFHDTDFPSGDETLKTDLSILDRHNLSPCLPTKANAKLTMHEYLFSRGYERELINRLIKEKRIYIYKKIDAHTKRLVIESPEKELDIGDQLEILFTVREAEFKSVQSSQAIGTIGRLPYTLETSVMTPDWQKHTSIIGSTKSGSTIRYTNTSTGRNTFPTDRVQRTKKMSLQDSYKLFWKNAFNFKGSVSRREFALTVAANAIALLAFTLIAGLFSALLGAQSSSASATLLGFYIIASMIAGISLQARRIRDTGLPPWLVLLMLVPYLGAFIVLALCCFPGKSQHNKHGRDYPDEATGSSRTSIAPTRDVDFEEIDRRQSEIEDILKKLKG